MNVAAKIFHYAFLYNCEGGKKIKKFRVICLCGLFLLVSSWCFAAVYSTLDHGGTYNQGSGRTTGYPGSGYIQGDQFSPTTTARLSDIELALSYVSGTGNSYVTLYNDSGGLPGAALASWTITNPALLPVFGNSNSALYTLTSVANPSLTAGTE